MHDQASLECSRAYLGGLSGLAIFGAALQKCIQLVSVLYHFTPDLEMTV